MKFTARDFPKIVWFAVLAALLIGLAIAAGLWSTGGAGKARAERDAAAARKLEIEKRLGRVRTEEQEIKERTKRFQQMEIAGNYPDMVVGCAGGGSNAAGLMFPFLKDKIQF